MQYETFCEYLQNLYWYRLFIRQGSYGNGHILKVDRDEITHVGDITLRGHVEGPFIKEQSQKYATDILACVSAHFHGLSCDNYIEWSKTYWTDWTLQQKPMAWWSWKRFAIWKRKQQQLPIILRCYGTSTLILDKVDFHLETTLRGDVPESIVMKKISLLKSSWLSKLGGRYITDHGECKVKRVGLHTCNIHRAENKDMLKQNLWDVPNNKSLLDGEMWIDTGKLGYLLYLPFVSLRSPNGSTRNTAFAFDYDDFLPNPRKRRTLFTLVKEMKKRPLDGYFEKQVLHQCSLGPSNPFKKPASSRKPTNVWEKKWLRLQAVTSHQPNSVLGEILLSGGESVVKFTIEYFSIYAEVINQLKIGRYCACELLARTGRLSLISRHVKGRLKLSGEVSFRPGGFERVWSTVFAAIEVDSVEYLRAAINIDDGALQLLHLRGYRGVTPLGLAVMKNKFKLVTVLLEARANVNQPSWGDETALCLALQIGVSREIIEELIKASAKVIGNDLTGNAIGERLSVKGIFVK